MCEFVTGAYDCWSFPCYNGGVCVDASDQYNCICQSGYGGESCKKDIDECVLEDILKTDGSGDWQHRAVCDVHASCTNEHGQYSCECEAGWEGDGYVEDGVLTSVFLGPQLVRPPWLSDDRSMQACQDIDACANSRCQNGATCLNMEGQVGLNDYDCECSDGPTGGKAWVGKNCQTDVDECDLGTDDCDSNADCENSPGGFICLCQKNWQSTDLNFVDRKGRMAKGADGELSIPGCYDWDDCSSGPCEHGGTCAEGPDGCEELNVDQVWVEVACYECECAYGFSGDNCEKDEDECMDSEDGAYMALKESCHDQAFCVNVPGSYECTCNAGWTGDGITCIDADDCEFSPCAHGGTCYDCGTLCFTCDCVVGWRGTTCGTDWNECIMGIHQCNDEATCANSPGSYDCRCDPGFTGDGFGEGFTELEHTYHIGANTVTEISFKGCKDINDCDPVLYDGPVLSPQGPCVKGVCTDVGPNAYKCDCEAGYTDSECDMNINECGGLYKNDCHRFATCKDTTGSYICTCNEGFTGNGSSSCLDISDCYNQCHHGFCTDLGVDHFRCNCDVGWMNRKCDYDINECTTYTHECARYALCSNTPGSYTCACNKGYAGDGMAQGSTCKDVDDCASNPCDWGTCKDEGVASYTCSCNDGYTDYNCDFDVNECQESHNCHVDARCVNTPGTFYCRCLSGWEGDGLTCTDLDDCDPDPCDVEHGTCKDQGPNLYHCDCTPGWTGEHCGDDQNECMVGTHSCAGAAQCANTLGSHTCVCNGGHWGNGHECTVCTTCLAGWKAKGVCKIVDLVCVDVDECVDKSDNCHEHATCDNTQGSFK